MVAGLLIASLGYSHNLGYWPRGVPATGQSSPSTEGGMVGIHWENFLYSLPVLVVGVLYWLGRRSGKAQSSREPVRAYAGRRSNIGEAHGIGSVTNVPKVTRDFVFTTSGSGRQTIDVGFPVDFLRLHSPEQIKHLTRSDLPTTVESNSEKLTISIEGSTVGFNDHGSKIPVEFIAYAAGTIEDQAEMLKLLAASYRH